MMKKWTFWLAMISLNHIALSAGDWVKNIGDSLGNVVIAGVVSDSEDNAVITGSFSSTKLVLDESNTLKNNGLTDLFLVKYDPQGDIIWAQSFGGDNEEYVNDICLDDKDNIYITGNFLSTSFKIGDSTIISSDKNNIYVAKFDRNGEFKWLKHSTNLDKTYSTQGTAVHYGEDGNIYFTGYTTEQEISFGEIDLSSDKSGSKGFYGRMDKGGNYGMAHFIEGMGEDQFQLNDIASDIKGNIYLGGIKTIHTVPDPVTGKEYWDRMYFCKVDPVGAIHWAVEDTSFHQSESIIYRHDSIFVLGSREEWRWIFNGGTIDTTSSFYYGIYDVNANILWDKKVRGALAYDMHSIDNSIVIIGGLLLDHFYLGDYHIQRNSDSSAICPIYQDVFFLESDNSGHIKKLESISGSLEDIPTGICLTNSGDLLYTGTYESYKLSIEGSDIINESELNVFNHVSGTYYDRRPYSFLARRSGFIDTVGFKKNEADRFLIYPNPANHYLYIRHEKLLIPASIELINMKGMVVRDIKMNPGETNRIDISGLPRGIYLIRLQDMSHHSEKLLIY